MVGSTIRPDLLKHADLKGKYDSISINLCLGRYGYGYAMPMAMPWHAMG